MKDLKKLDDAIRKIRVDFPTFLQEEFHPGPTIQEIFTSEKKEEEFGRVYQMTVQGMRPLIAENTEALKDSAVQYHAVHKALRSTLAELKEAEEKTKTLHGLLETSEVSKHLETLKKEIELEEKEKKEGLVKQALAVDVLTIKNIYSGRLGIISSRLKHVMSSGTRAAIKKRVEEEVWKIKREIEERVRHCMAGTSVVSQIDVSVLLIVNGSYTSVLYAAVEDGVVELINKAAESVKTGLTQNEKTTKQDEIKVLSKVLQQFTLSAVQLLEKVKDIAKKGKEALPKLQVQSYRHHPGIYSEIELGEEEHPHHSTLSLPLANHSPEEEEIFRMITRWIKKFFKRLVGESAHISEEGECAVYDISKINRTADSFAMYKEYFLGKYGIEPTAADNVSSAASVHNIYAVTTDEAVLVVHGASLVISDALRRVLAEILPDSLGLADELKDLGIAQCFNKKKANLLSQIDQACLQVQADHSAAFLEKYIRRTRKVLQSVSDFVQMPAEGLEKEIEECMKEVLEKLLPSIEHVFRILCKIPEGGLLPIQYTVEDKITEEILRWNPPTGQNVLGESIFNAVSNQRFLSMSEFLSLEEDILHTIENVSDSTKVLDINKQLLQMKDTTKSLFAHIYGYFLSHFLALARTALDQLVSVGDVLDKRFMHFLSMDTQFIKRCGFIVQQYVCMHLFSNIEKCAKVLKVPAFKHSLSVIQAKLEDVVEPSSTPYVPMYIFYALPALQMKDRIYSDTLQQIYKDNPLISQNIQKYFASLQ